MAPTPHATLQAITEAAADAAGATWAWLLAAESDELVVVTAVGADAGAAVGRTIAAGQGSAGYVLSSGQPLAIQIHTEASSPWAAEHPLVGRVPDAILSVPCPGPGDAGVYGVLELLDCDRGAFSFDDVEIVSLLGAIAGSALSEGIRHGPTVAHPDELARELLRLFVDDPPAYARVAAVLQALLARD